MNREERRRAERAQRKNEADGGPSLSSPAQGRLIRSTAFTEADEARQRQDFLAGTVFAAGADVALPQDGPGAMPIGALFVVYVHEDERTFGPAPQLREAFTLLDEIGTFALNERMDVGTGWSGMGGHDPLVKLKLEFHGPHPKKGAAGLILLGNQYAGIWHHIVGGGLLGITTQERMRQATRRPGATFSDGLEACIMLGLGTSPVLEQFIDGYGWPRT
ncbi:hypothetical protein [Streptomyces sp. cg36]|uniref:hypothetical protein n=1 Tax=Streptomyces sp. cg36 TaxID=3238798 RepID=UPI0034E2B5E4